MKRSREALLDKPIEIPRSDLEAQPPKASRFSLFSILGTALSFCCLEFGRMGKLSQAAAMSEAALEEDHSDPSDRFLLVCFWTYVARHYNHASTEAAYQNAMSAMQDSLVVGPTIQM